MIIQSAIQTQLKENIMIIQSTILFFQTIAFSSSPLTTDYLFTISSELVYYPCRRCLMEVIICYCIRSEHYKIYGIPDSIPDYENDEKLDEVKSSTYEELDEDEDMEPSDLALENDIDMNSDTSGEESFPYHQFTEISLPDIYKCNFSDLAWKMCCNVSDNAYDQMKYTKDDNFRKGAVYLIPTNYYRYTN